VKAQPELSDAVRFRFDSSANSADFVLRAWRPTSSVVDGLDDLVGVLPRVDGRAWEPLPLLRCTLFLSRVQVQTTERPRTWAEKGS